MAAVAPAPLPARTRPCPHRAGPQLYLHPEDVPDGGAAEEGGGCALALSPDALRTPFAPAAQRAWSRASARRAPPRAAALPQPPHHPIPARTHPGIASGSGKPNTEKVGQVTRAQVEEIARKKLPDTNATKVDSVMRMVEGTARNMGLVVVD